MKFEKFRLGMLMANSYLFYSDETKKAIIFDVGGSPRAVVEFLNSNELELEYIVLTHGHGDHIGGVEQLKEFSNAKVVGHKKDLDMLKNADYNLSSQIGKRVEIDLDIIIEDGQELNLAGFDLKFYHTPGHTPGSICIKLGNYLISGDTLFRSSIGRTDFPGGDSEAIMKSLKKISKFSPELIVLPGHEDSTTIERELRVNPFMRRL